MLTSWNHAELEVHYQCLQNEVKIGDYYLRILLEQRDNDDSPIRKSYEFFNDLYHRFLSTPKVEMKCMCLQAMTIVYGRYFEDIGPFADTKYIVQMLDRRRPRVVLQPRAGHTAAEEGPRQLPAGTLHTRSLTHIAGHGAGAEQNVIEAGAATSSGDREWYYNLEQGTLLQRKGPVSFQRVHCTLAHSHTSRATVPAQSNVIEAGAGTSSGDREWYYNLEQGTLLQRKGPVSFQRVHCTLAHSHTSRATVPAQSNVIEAGAATSSGDREWYYNLEQGTLLQRKCPVSFQRVHCTPVSVLYGLYGDANGGTFRPTTIDITPRDKIAIKI
ncbi:putative DnaJ-like protein, subfamily C, member 13 [Operophtera brumata]|uniref:Putative DnaJ-like protein, subfamily C, member 13 n=1 Tax=Operophtera brumata TaxID=104452 RepID=A0A0L7KTB9_OPEBR|nr:putative DnaJ-like protein, subfamily C, member 13 [Operophtera brumata]